MEKFSVSESGMKAGDVCQLVRASHVEMMIVDENHANVLVDGQVIMEGLALYEATDFAKRLNNPNLQDSTKFHTPREWTFKASVSQASLKATSSSLFVQQRTCPLTHGTRTP
jgi:hypothetical protein